MGGPLRVDWAAALFHRLLFAEHWGLSYLDRCFAICNASGEERAMHEGYDLVAGCRLALLSGCLTVRWELGAAFSFLLQKVIYLYVSFLLIGKVKLIIG